MEECSGVQQMLQESHGVDTFALKCVKVNSSARLFMMLHIPPMLQTPAISLEWKYSVGQCICCYFPRRESNWKEKKLLKCEVAFPYPLPSVLDYLIVRKTLIQARRAFLPMVALVPAPRSVCGDHTVTGVGQMTGNEFCCKRGAIGWVDQCYLQIIES